VRPWVCMQTGAVHGLERGPAAPEATLRPRPVRTEDADGGGALACARCLARVTRTGERISVGGGHEHTFANPEGYSYRIGCFARAAVVAVGGSSAYWTWFQGFRWTIELCGDCGEHLGWLFRSADSEFHGLILDRLVSLDEDA